MRLLSSTLLALSLALSAFMPIVPQAMAQDALQRVAPVAAQRLAQNFSQMPQDSVDVADGVDASDDSQGSDVLIVAAPPPSLPVYAQPALPAAGLIWAPGYWSYDVDFGYYWVPGTWVEAPQPGLLWTPGYWAYDNGAYRYYDGYWGEHVGFYGGIDYGYGYTGDGYEGGRWQDGHFYYNRSVNNLAAATLAYVYAQPILGEPAGPYVSYNGGTGGLTAQPTALQEGYAHEPHVRPTAVQRTQLQTARRDPALRETANGGRPPIAATPRPGDFKGPGVVAAQSAGLRPAEQAVPQGNINVPLSPNHKLPVPGQTPGLPAVRPLPHVQSPAAPESREEVLPSGAERHDAPAGRLLPHQAEPRQVEPRGGPVEDRPLPEPRLAPQSVAPQPVRPEPQPHVQEAPRLQEPRLQEQRVQEPRFEEPRAQEAPRPQPAPQPQVHQGAPGQAQPGAAHPAQEHRPGEHQ